MIHPVNDQWAVGFAMMTNYGLGTRFDDSFGAGSVSCRRPVGG